MRLLFDEQLAGAYALAALVALLLLVAAAAVVGALLEGYSFRRRERAFEQFLVEVEDRYRQLGEGRSKEEEELDQESGGPDFEVQRRAVLGALLGFGGAVGTSQR